MSENIHQRSKSSNDDGNNTVFPVQLMSLLDANDHPDIVSWLSDGTGFVIRDERRFEAEIMPIYFTGAKKYASFQRRLRRWGFNRGFNGAMANAISYRHPSFIRGDLLRCSNIEAVPQARKNRRPRRRRSVQNTSNVRRRVDPPSPPEENTRNVRRRVDPHSPPEDYVHFAENDIIRSMMAGSPDEVNISVPQSNPSVAPILSLNQLNTANIDPVIPLNNSNVQQEATLAGYQEVTRHQESPLLRQRENVYYTNRQYQPQFNSLQQTHQQNQYQAQYRAHFQNQNREQYRIQHHDRVQNHDQYRVQHQDQYPTQNQATYEAQNQAPYQAQNQALYQTQYQAQYQTDQHQRLQQSFQFQNQDVEPRQHQNLETNPLNFQQNYQQQALQLDFQQPPQYQTSQYLQLDPHLHPYYRSLQQHQEQEQQGHNNNLSSLQVYGRQQISAGEEKDQNNITYNSDVLHEDNP